jgi:2-methylcitrate dehydratase
MNATAHADPSAIDTGVAGESRRHRLPTRVERLARFVCRSGWNDISEPAGDPLKLRLLDSLGVSFGALDGTQVALVREHVREFGGAPLPTLIGAGQRSALRSTPRGVALTLGRT